MQCDDSLFVGLRCDDRSDASRYLDARTPIIMSC